MLNDDWQVQRLRVEAERPLVKSTLHPWLVLDLAGGLYVMLFFFSSRLLVINANPMLLRNHLLNLVINSVPLRSAQHIDQVYFAIGAAA